MENQAKPGFWVKVATVIVDKRGIFFLFFIGACIFSMFSMGWVKTNNDLTKYLPEDTETRRALVIMEDEFTTYATARVMVSNISMEQALRLKDVIADTEGVTSVTFYDPESEDSKPEDYFRSASALYSLTFAGEQSDEICEEAMASVKEKLSGYDSYIDSEVGSDINETVASEMQVVMLVAVVVIIVVLLFTSKTYIEVIVLLMTFGAAALLNMGTNFLMGEISFVTNSIAVILQLALAVDYAIILCHRFTEERQFNEAREACINALSKSIPEISSSSMTTISGLAAMCLMQFRIGADMGTVLIKAIFLSLFTVFTLMPGLLMLFSGLMDKTRHKSFVPKITGWGRLAVKTRYIMPPLFVAILVGAFLCSNRCPYVFGYSTLTTFKQNESQIAEQKIKDTFGTENAVAMIVPAGDYEKEKALLRDLGNLEHVESALGLSSVEVMDGIVLTDSLSPRELSELIDMDYEVVELLYAAYAAEHEDYGKIVGGLEDYKLPLIDVVFFLKEQIDEGYVTLDGELSDMLDSMYSQLVDAKKQLSGENYIRMLVQLDLPEESQETFDYLQVLRDTGEKYYDEVILAGDSTSDYDLSSSFTGDNLLISILSALFVIIVLIFTFRSAGLPALLIIVIQGSIWINFSFPYLMNKNLFFMSYLIVSSIQMGANIDYAIVISSRYVELKGSMDYKEAIVEAMNLAFPTIITSGTMLASAGILISLLSSEPTVSSIGECLGRGTIISIILVMGILPQILVLGDTIIEKTAFHLKGPAITHKATGTIWVRGRVRGYINGVVDANINGVVKGTLSAIVEAGSIEKLDRPKLTDSEAAEAGLDAEVEDHEN